MAPIRIPDGFVLVQPRSVETATALLDAARKIGADRHLSVRTVTGGYHVLKEVAEEYQKGFPAVDQSDVVSAADGDADAQAAQADAEAQAAQAGTEKKPEGDALPITAESSHADIDAFAATLDLKFPANTNRADKITQIEAARAQKAEEAE